MWCVLVAMLLVELSPLPNRSAAAQVSASSTDISYYIDDISWSPDGELVAVLGSDGVRVYSDTLQEVDHFQQSITRLTRSLSWSPDATRLATVGDGSIYIWKRSANDTFVLERVLRIEGYLQVLVSWSPDGTKLASQDLPDVEELQGESSRVHIWNTTTWDRETTLSQAYSYGERVFPVSLRWNDDGSLLSGTGSDGVYADVVWIADAYSGQRTQVFPQTEPALSFDWHSSQLLAVGGATYVGVYDTSVMRLLYTIGYPQAYDVSELSWSPGGVRLLVHTYNGAEVWDYSTAQPIATFPNSYQLAWSPDGTRVVSGAINPNTNSRALTVWDVSGLAPIIGVPTLTPYPVVNPTVTSPSTSIPTPASTCTHVN